MDLLYLLNLVVSLAISVFLIILFFKHYNNKKLNHITHKLAVIGLAHFVISFLSLLWFLGFIEYAVFDFLFVYSLVVLVQTIFFIMIFSLLYNKGIVFLLFFYVLGFFSFFYSGINLSFAFLFISFLLLIIVFVFLISKEDFEDRVGYFGLFYASVSLIFTVLDVFNIGNAFVYGFFSSLLFFILVYTLFSSFKKFPVSIERKTKKVIDKSSSFFEVIRYFVFIITIVNLVFIGTIGLNEFGHYYAAEFYDCQYKSVVYGEEGVHTELLCKNVSEKIVILAGVFLPFLAALFLFIIGGTFLREIALLVAGFGLLSAYKDLLDLGLSNNLVIASSVTGLLFLVIGIVLLSQAGTEEHLRESLSF